MSTELGDRMRRRAEADGLPADHELRRRAEAFDNATAGYYGEPQTITTQQFLGAWARARKAWCAYTGEPLI
jgi:hypothetical protein